MAEAEMLQFAADAADFGAGSPGGLNGVRRHARTLDPGEGGGGSADEDEHPGLRAFYNNPDCPNCGNIFGGARTVTTFFGTASFVVPALPAIVYSIPFIPAAVNEIGLTFEASFPGATAIGVDVLESLSPVPYTPSTAAGLVVEGYGLYQWWKQH